MRQEFKPQPDPSDNLQANTTMPPQEVSPLWTAVYASLGAPGGSAIQFETPVSTGPANLQQTESNPEQLRALFVRLTAVGGQQDNRVDPRDLATLRNSLDSPDLLEALHNFRANFGEGALQFLFDKLRQQDPTLADRIRQLYENSLSSNPNGLASQFGPMVAAAVDQHLINSTPDRVSSRILMLLGVLNSGGAAERQNAESEIQNTFGEAALPFLRQILRNPPNQAMYQAAERMIANITAANR
jgi:hypothetical protein